MEIVSVQAIVKVWEGAHDDCTSYPHIAINPHSKAHTQAKIH